MGTYPGIVARSNVHLLKRKERYLKPRLYGIDKKEIFFSKSLRYHGDVSALLWRLVIKILHQNILMFFFFDRKL